MCHSRVVACSCTSLGAKFSLSLFLSYTFWGSELSSGSAGWLPVPFPFKGVNGGLSHGGAVVSRDAEVYMVHTRVHHCGKTENGGASHKRLCVKAAIRKKCMCFNPFWIGFVDNSRSHHRELNFC